MDMTFTKKENAMLKAMLEVKTQQKKPTLTQKGGGATPFDPSRCSSAAGSGQEQVALDRVTCSAASADDLPSASDIRRLVHASSSERSTP